MQNNQPCGSFSKVFSVAHKERRMKVLKRNGDTQELDLKKIHAVLDWACNGHNDDALTPIKGVSVSQIEMQAQLMFYDGIRTYEIHEALIRAASELISDHTPNYDKVAARLTWFSIRKEAFKNNLPPHLARVIEKNVQTGFYTKDIYDAYSAEEINQLNSFMDHTRDDLLRYAGAEQLRRKYLTQNRKTKQVFESFQFPYILVAALLFSNYPKETRMGYVKRYYDAISTHEISLPTPIMAGVRTPDKQFSSCVTLSAGDSLDEITGAATTIVKYAAAKAGIGIDIGRIRAVGQPIRGGKAVTTGVIPFTKFLVGALKSCSQGALRGASATVNYPMWHLEFEKMIELKNEKGTEETRIRNVDYCVHINSFLIQRWANDSHITLFSPEEVPDLYDAFYGKDQSEFERLYLAYEKNPDVSKKKISAKDAFIKILMERFETGRIYLFFADNVNSQSPFLESVTTTNLCCEIALPTKPVSQYSEDGRVSLCTLSAINWGKFMNIRDAKTAKHMEDVCDLAVRALDALLDYQDYMTPDAKRATMEYRPLGIGIIGFAHWLAKNRLKWGEEKTLTEVDLMMEHMAYYLTKSSINLAREFGPCKKTRYHEGWLPMDASPLGTGKTMPWDELREQAKTHGIRNATLMALMPSETSSQLANETNGIEAPQFLVSVKASKDGNLNQVVPEFSKLALNYQTMWDIDCLDYIKTLAHLQKYIDQAISANTFYNPARYPGGKIPMSAMARNILVGKSLGLKTFYYNKVMVDGEVSDDGCESGACKI